MAKKPKESSKKIAKIRIDMLSSRIEALEDEFDLTANTLIARKRASTGVLALDLQWGGGMVPGMYTIAGIERSGKSTIITQIFGEMVREKLAVCNMRDAEGTVGVDIDYTRALLGGDLDVGELISGNSVKKSSKDEQKKLQEMTRPRIHVEANIEETYEYFRAVLDLLPDKIYSKKDGCWMFKAPNTKLGQEQMAILGPDAPIEKRKKKSGGDYLYAPTEDGLIGFIAIDSYPALIPTAVDEEGKRSKRMGQEASAFANSLPLVVEKLVKKGFAILGANQLRENPGDQYNPWREPGGNALKQFSQVRDWISAISPSTIKTTPALWEKGEYPWQALCMEKSVEDIGPNDDPKSKGNDYYQFSQLSNKKNKTATPLGRAEIRIWTRDRYGKGRGIDPVFDVWFYLSEMQLATVHAKRITCEELFGDKKPHWLDFKKIIISEVYGTDKEHEEAWKRLKMKPRKIREWCFADLRRRTNADPEMVEKDMMQAANEADLKKKEKASVAPNTPKPGKDRAADKTNGNEPGKKMKKVKKKK